ncbi:MAG: TldD/PmbA family protein [Chloroflexota bacterium]
MFEQVLDMAKSRVEQAEVYELESEVTPVSFEANRLKAIQTKQTHGLALRVVKDGRIGLASTTDFRPHLTGSGHGIASLVDRAIAAAQFGAEARFQLPGRAQPANVAVFDPIVAALTPEDMIALGQTMIDRVCHYDSDILCSVQVSKTLSTVTIANGRGEQVSYSKTLKSVSLNGNLTTGTDILDIGEEAHSCRDDINVERLVGDVVSKFDMAKREASITTKHMPVIFTPKGVASVFLLPLQMALNGKVVLQGASPLGDKVGQVVFDPRVSLFDDGTVDFAPHSAGVDDEAVPTRRTTLVEKGRVQGFIYDLQTAALAGKSSTGNGFRGLSTLPTPTFTSLIFSEGVAVLPDMIQDVKEGVLIDQVMGAWAGNLLAGEVSGNIHLGFKIENGILVGRVKDAMVAGSIYEALSTGLNELGSEGTWVNASLYTPPMYFKGLSIATKRG